MNPDNIYFTFDELPIGAHFTWRTNLGAGDRFVKMSADTVRNITLKTEEKGLGYFRPTDPVTLIHQ